MAQKQAGHWEGGEAQPRQELHACGAQGGGRDWQPPDAKASTWPEELPGQPRYLQEEELEEGFGLTPALHTK